MSQTAAAALGPVVAGSHSDPATASTMERTSRSGLARAQALCALLLLSCACGALALDNGLGQKPAMGFNT